MASTFDARFMARAVKLAQKGRFTTAERPNIGCVITLGHQIIGEGFEQANSAPNALKQGLDCTALEEGLTCYLTMEPDSSWLGLLLNSGFSRIVFAMASPGESLRSRLEGAGIQVEIGLLSGQAQALNSGYLHRLQTGLPYVRVKLAASLDGKTALNNGVSKWITGSQARADVQRWRAQSCAVLTGSGTVLADDPSMNVRWSELGSVKRDYPQKSVRQPKRIIIDSGHLVDDSKRVFSLPGDTLLVGTRHRHQLPKQATALTVNENSQGKVDLKQLLQQLGKMEINDLWVEAGAELAGALFEQELVDELILYQAPKLMGSSARSLLQLSEYTAMAQVPELDISDVRKIGADIRIIAKPVR